MIKAKKKDEMHENGISLKAFFQVQNRRRELVNALKRAGVKLGEDVQPEAFERNNVIRCLAAGLVRYGRSGSEPDPVSGPKNAGRSVRK